MYICCRNYCSSYFINFNSIGLQKHKKFFRAYTTVSIATLLILLTMDYFGNAEWWIDFCHKLLEMENKNLAQQWL